MTSPDQNLERRLATELVERIGAGDRNAEAEMVERYSRGLRFLLRRKTRHPDLTEDLLQETWAIALVKLRDDGLADPGRLAGYLCGIANNLARGEQRRQQRQRTSVNSEIVDLVPDEEATSPFRHVTRAEVCRQVRGLLDELEMERDREILRRFYVQDEDKEVICSYLDMDSAHFNRVLFRARQRLKKVLEVAYRRGRIRVVG